MRVPHVPRFNLGNTLLALALALFVWLLVTMFWPRSHDHLIPVCDTWGRYGYINEHGQLIIPCQFKWAGPFGVKDTALVHTNNDAVFINKEGNVTLQVPMTPLRNFDEHGMTLFLHNGKFGWMDQEGKVLLPAIWEWADDFDAKDMAAVEVERGWRWIDRKGQFVFPGSWSTLTRAFDSEGWAAVEVNDRTTFIDRKGNVVLQTNYRGAQYNFDSHGWAMMRDNKRYDWINRQGKVQLSYEADECHEFDSFGWAAFRKDKTIGWINRQGQVVLTMPLDQCCTFATNTWAVIVRNQLHGVIDRQGNEMLPPIWSRGIFRIDQADPNSPIFCCSDLVLPTWLENTGKKVFQFLGKPWTPLLKCHVYNSKFELLWRSDGWVNHKEWYLGLGTILLALLGLWLKLKSRKSLHEKSLRV